MLFSPAGEKIYKVTKVNAQVPHKNLKFYMKYFGSLNLTSAHF